MNAWNNRVFLDDKLKAKIAGTEDEPCVALAFEADHRYWQQHYHANGSFVIFANFGKSNPGKSKMESFLNSAEVNP